MINIKTSKERLTIKSYYGTSLKYYLLNFNEGKHNYVCLRLDLRLFKESLLSKNNQFKKILHNYNTIAHDFRHNPHFQQRWTLMTKAMVAFIYKQFRWCCTLRFHREKMPTKSRWNVQLKINCNYSLSLLRTSAVEIASATAIFVNRFFLGLSLWNCVEVLRRKSSTELSSVFAHSSTSRLPYKWVEWQRALKAFLK